LLHSFADIAADQLKRPISFRVLGRLRKTRNLDEVISNEEVRMLYAYNKSPKSSELKVYQSDSIQEINPDHKQNPLLIPKKPQGVVNLSTSNVFNNKKQNKIKSYLWEERFIKQHNNYEMETHKSLKQKSLSETTLRLLPKYPLLKSYSDSKIQSSFKLPNFSLSNQKNISKQIGLNRFYSNNSLFKVPLFNFEVLQAKDYKYVKQNAQSKRKKLKENKRVRLCTKPISTHFY